MYDALVEMTQRASEFKPMPLVSKLKVNVRGSEFLSMDYVFDSSGRCGPKSHGIVG
jgi:hypothetical protein